MTRKELIQVVGGFALVVGLIVLFNIYYDPGAYDRKITERISQFTPEMFNKPDEYGNALWVRSVYDDPYPFDSYEEYLEAFCRVHPIVCRDMFPELADRVLP